LAGAEAIVGPFVNNLPVRVDVEPQATAGALLQTLQARTLELSAFQFTSLLDIQRCSEVPWRYRLFDSLVVFQNYRVDDAARRLGGQIDIADFRGPVHTNFPVLLLVEPGETLDLTLIYDCHRLAAGTIDRWCADLAILLTQLPQTLDEPVARLLAQLSEPARPAARAMPTRAAGIALPRTPMERSIADICQPLFALDQINVEENFFDLGATSLLLVQMHERLRSSLNTDFSVVTLFQHPTVRALATHLDERKAPSAPSGSAASASPAMSAQRQRAEQQKQALARLRTRPKK
jgi:aryl carrier-like protein